MRGFDELTHGKHCVWCLEESSVIESIREARQNLWPWASQRGKVALSSGTNLWGPGCGEVRSGEGSHHQPEWAPVLGRLPPLLLPKPLGQVSEQQPFDWVTFWVTVQRYYHGKGTSLRGQTQEAKMAAPLLHAWHKDVFPKVCQYLLFSPGSHSLPPSLPLEFLRVLSSRSLK